MSEAHLSPSRTPSSRAAYTAFLVDLVMVIAFIVVGRSSHDRDLLRGLANTIWPFLVALVVAWIVSRAWKSPIAPIRTGMPVWAVTAVVGMLLRWAAGQGVQTGFVFVGAGVLFLFLVGWRLIVALVSRRRA